MPLLPFSSWRGVNGANLTPSMLQARLFELGELVAGVDEAGRGPLAGPVVASAVILRPDDLIPDLADSKKLSASRRNVLARQIRARALSWSVAWADPGEIDELNILAATMLAMRRSISFLSVTPTGVQVDGNRLPDLEFDGLRLQGEAIVGGDGKIAAISAASIIAKTTRDGIMEFLDRVHPEYEFARHKGYGTRVHLERLRRHGPCEQHRASFAPVRAAG